MSPTQQSMFDTPVARARQLKAAGHYAEAAELLICALRNQPDDRKLKASLADAHYRLAHFHEALTLAGEILRDDPNDQQALVVIGNVLLARKKPREALTQYMLALASAENDYLWTRCARCHLDLKDPQAALTAVHRGQALSPDNHELLQLQLEAAKKLGDTDLVRATELRLSLLSSKENP
jgi:tetratricopeptide (TPR) repeat protein